MTAARTPPDAPDAPGPTAVAWSLLPGELAGGHTGGHTDGPAGSHAGGRVRRTPRDWTVDVVAFCWAVLAGAAVFGHVVQTFDHLPGWLVAVDLPLGALGCLSLWWRRRYPLTVALLATPMLALANSGFGAGMVIILNLALRVPWQRAVPVLCLYVAASVPYMALYAVPHEGGWSAAAFIFAYHLVFFAWGSALRARRMLVLKLREDAERDRVEHARRLADARRAERGAIAREMHDVLAHRISLLSVHAGALVYRTRQSGAGAGPALSGAEVAESAQVIRDNAHQALDELRQVLHVLRGGTDPGVEGAAPPQPRVGDVANLVAEARAAGQHVELRDGLGAAARDGAVPHPQVQRTAYRVVQEGLTNARKHAPDARVTVRLDGAPGAGLTVEVGNALPVGVTASEIPGAGAGLAGLGERVALDGGDLEHGSRNGTFTLRARLPWPAG